MVIICFTLEELPLLSTASTPFHSPTKKVDGFQFLHIFSNTYEFSLFFFLTIDILVVSHCGFEKLSMFSLLPFWMRSGHSFKLLHASQWSSPISLLPMLLFFVLLSLLELHTHLFENLVSEISALPSSSMKSFVLSVIFHNSSWSLWFEFLCEYLRVMCLILREVMGMIMLFHYFHTVLSAYQKHTT